MFKLLVILLLFITGIPRQVGIDRCKPFLSYQQCILSKQSKCQWNQLKQQCLATSDYLQGCNQNLNLPACLDQIGDVLQKIANCRFTTKCEEIPDPKTERCLNNLNKSGCLSIVNPQQVCVWKENQCSLLEQEDYDQITKNFDSTFYSVSACSHIEHYLAVHHFILWGLIGYTPNLMLQANIAYLQDEGIETNTDQNYDDPAEIQLQNNIITYDGQFKWYTIRESKSVTLRNLRISDRYREGCIAIEIENDSDYEIIFNIEGTVLGVNHVYCKYLNKLLKSAPYYVFSQGQCRKFDQSLLNDQKQIDELNLNCFSFNVAYCIYFDSLKFPCQIYGEEYEYHCQPLKDSNNVNCDNSPNCTVQQCKKFGNFYIDNETNVCTNTCYKIQNQYDCQNESNCFYLGNQQLESSIICSPSLICDQIGVSLNSCKYLKDKCQWDYTVQKCFSITDDQIQFLKCDDVVSVYVCTYITLSDQLCYWDLDREICSNVLNQPILLTYGQYIGVYEQWQPDEYYFNTISNVNLCQSNEGIYSHYDEDQRICNLTLNAMSWNDSFTNKYNCLNSEPGFCKWNQQFGKCECFQSHYFADFECQDLINVNEKCCQFAQTSNINFICIFNSLDNNCYENNIDELINLSCEGIGLSKQLCISKKLCRYQANLCEQLDNSYINSLSCSTFHNINHNVCEQHNKDSQLCDYDEKTSSCYSPSQLNQIQFRNTLNRFACQRVIDYPTYFDVMKNLCLIFNDEITQFYSIFTCEDYFLSKMACELIVTDGQLCYWDQKINKCKQLTLEFAKCSDYSIYGERICKGLQRNLRQMLIKENFCQFLNGECLSVISTVSDCGESQKMNLHRCNSLTGLDQDGTPIKMCAFINFKCTSLNEGYYDDQLILNQIECKQANFATCVKVTTPGQFCVITIRQNVNKAVLDQKCQHQKNEKLNCFQLNQLNDQSKINKNFCAQANDTCQFKENFGCTSPSSENLTCDQSGLSLLACQLYTNYHRCAFIDNQCQYLSENVVLNNCSLLNKFLCQNYKFAQCIWKENNCIFDEIDEQITEFTCSRDEDEQYLAYQDGQCIELDEIDLQNLTCESVGLNKYTCQRLNQYCIFQQNQCQYSRKILCEDSRIQSECSSNDSGFQNCVFQDGKCFDVKKELQYECDEFEGTNFNFCYQFPDCIYFDNKCQQIQAIIYQYCYTEDILTCVFNNFDSSCYYDTKMMECVNLYKIDHCYQFEGYYSRMVCNSIENCHYGYTKSGFGFCYEGNINDITCELLPEMFCTEELSHLNNNLNCYYDDQCKTLEKENQTCIFLSQFPSNYSACALVSQSGDCFYSHTDRICKSTLEYTDTICQGVTHVQCSQIKNICYFEDDICQSSGQVQNLNKYGCTIQQGLWQFVNFNCLILLEDTILNSCYSISKDACLSSITQELNCRWDTETIKCVQVFEYEGQLIKQCENLNERACINIRLSTLQCFWNSDSNECEKITFQDTNCTLLSSEINVSISLCSNQLNNPCILNEKQKKCEILDIQINSCTKYGLNEIACINNTKDYCQWYQINNGSYCKQTNLFTALCNQGLNKKSCQNLKTKGQYCFWNDSLKQCQNKALTNCQSANYLNLQYPCFAVEEEKCWYSSVSNECLKLETNPLGCNGNIYNKVSCLYEGQNCIWKHRRCVSLDLFECGQQLNRKFCLTSFLSCEWKNEACIPFFSNDQQHCIDLPKNISDSACRQYSFEPCVYSISRDQCYTEFNIADYDFYTISDILSYQDEDFTSPILSGSCEDLLFKKDCISSRKQDQACKWKDSCKLVEEQDFNQLMCIDALNIYGCLGVTTQNQLCVWQGRCFEWNQSINRQTYVNINVCKYYSVNKVYRNYSCAPINIDEIKCLDPGISKETCLSITKQQCEWNSDLEICVEFQYSNQQKCIEYQQVSVYVCQIQRTDSCKHNKDTKNCEEVEKNSLAVGISLKACLQNDEQPIYWDGEICQIFNQVLECNEQLKVNPLSCITRTTQPCIYDFNQQICTSIFNAYSIRCTTQGINKLACFQVQSEPCIFSNGRCQEFTDVNSPCNQLRDVNSKACASIQSEICEFNQIEHYCQTPKILNEICNVDGINKNLCQLNEICRWNNDYKNCKCYKTQIIEQCNQEKINDCLQNSNCIFENHVCKLKQCYHLSNEDCNNVFLNNNFCYLSLNRGCQSAQICDDITDTSIQCSKVYINSIPCLQGNNFCYSHNNYEIFCPNSDCLQSQCVQELGQCRKKMCSDYDSNECNKQDGCYFNFLNKCEDLVTCNLITEEIFAITASSLCNKVSVNDIKCNWQQISVFDEEIKYCTNQYCQLYSSSFELCHGNEINNVACILSNAFLCKSCEEINEECYCNSLVNICKFEQGKCISILCQQFQTQDQCMEAKARCYWSLKNNGSCLLNCNKIILVDECNQRENECYYDYTLSSCLTGKKVVPDLSVEITIEQFYGNILTIILIIILVLE